MTEEMKKRVDEVAAFFVSDPDYEEIFGEYPFDGRRFRFLPTYRKTYHGTYLNPFSLIDRVDGKPLLWKDHIAEECAEVRISPVYRHNGTAADVTVGVAVLHCHASVGYLKSRLYNREYAAIVAAESPTDYVKGDSFISVSDQLVGAFYGKVSKTAKSKAIANVVSKAAYHAMLFEPKDWSSWARNPADYHKDTTAEYSKWHDDRRKETLEARKEQYQ